MSKDPLCPKLHNDFMGKLVWIKRMFESSPSDTLNSPYMHFFISKIILVTPVSPVRREVLVRMSGSRQNQPFINCQHSLDHSPHQFPQETFSSSTLVGRTRWEERSSGDGARRCCSGAAFARRNGGRMPRFIPIPTVNQVMTTHSFSLSTRYFYRYRIAGGSCQSKPVPQVQT